MADVTRGAETTSMDVDDGQSESPCLPKQTDGYNMSSPLSYVSTVGQIREVEPPAEGESTGYFCNAFFTLYF